MPKKVQLKCLPFYSVNQKIEKREVTFFKNLKNDVLGNRCFH